MKIDLYPCEYIRVKCISRGDPRPELEMINLNEPAFVKSSLQYDDEVTISTPLLFISQAYLSHDSKYNRLLCTGINLYGQSSFSLQLNKVMGKRKKEPQGYGIKTLNGCYEGKNPNYASHILMTKLLCIINFYYTFLNL